MPKLMLAEITAGMAVDTLVCLRQKSLAPYRNKTGQFLVLVLGDRSGSMKAKSFAPNAEEIYASLTEGAIIRVTGTGDTYQGIELKLETVEPWTGEVERADFMPAYAGDPAALEARFNRILASIRHPELAQLLEAIFGEPAFRAKFREAPAAKEMHGAYLYGLLEHVVRQAELADAVCRQYPQADRDLLITGVLLHDIGKTEEYSWEMSIDVTPFGRLVGHAVIGDRLIFERGREVGLSEETALRLHHLILSHHGTRDFGAVVLPQTLEAILLHCLDYLEAKANRAITMLATGDPASPWSEYDRIEGHFWYRGLEKAEV